MAKKSFHRLHDHGHFDGKILGQYSSSTSKDGSPSTYVAASAPEINGAAEDSIAQKKNENDNISSFSGNASVASSSPERAVAPPKAIPKATSNAKVYPYKPHKKLVPTGPPQHDRFHFFSSHPTHKELVRDPDSGQWIPVEDGAPPTPQVQQVLPQAWHTPSPFHQLPHATAKTPVQKPSFPTKKSAAPSSNNKAATTKKSKEKKSVAKKTGAAAVLPPPNGNQDNTSQDDALPSLSIDTTNNAHTTVKKTAENSPVAFETTAALISTPTNIPGTTTTTVAIATDAQLKDQDKSHAEPNQHDSGTTQSVSDKHDDAPSPSVNKSIITIRAGNYVVTAEPALSPRSQVQSIDQTEPDQEMKMPSLVETTKATASASIQKSDQAKPVQHLNELLSTYSTVLSSIKKSDQAAPDQHENVPSSIEIEDITKVASIQKSDQAAPDQHQNVPSSVEIENTTKVASIQKSDQAAPDQHEHVQSSAESKRTSTGASIQKSDQTAPTQHEYVQSSAKSKSTSIGASIYNNNQGDAPEEHANVLTSAEAKNSTTGASIQNSVQVAPKQQENVPSTIETNNTGTVASIQNSVQGDVPDQHAKVPSLVETKNTTPEHTIAEGESFDDCYDSAYGEYERKRRWEELLTQRPSKQECIDDKKAMQIWMREVLRVSDFSQNYH